MTQQDAEKLLGLPQGYSQEDLRKAYKSQARKHHPDIAGAGATTKFIQIKKAYEFLSNLTPVNGKIIFTHHSIFTIVRQP